MKIVHISDLHFGTEQLHLEEKLIEKINQLSPDLVVISGDFTQVGSAAEFIKAKNFIEILPFPVFTVPGNHDISRYNFLERLFAPYKKYKKYINENLNPFIEMNGIFIQGLNSARRILPHWNWAHGAVSKAQIKMLNDHLAEKKYDISICVLHHPVHKSEIKTIPVTVFGSKRFLKTVEDINVNVVLTGHVHHPSATQIGNTVFISASTALSSRKRGYENGFNFINLDKETLIVEHYECDSEESFINNNVKRFSLCT